MARLSSPTVLGALTLVSILCLADAPRADTITMNSHTDPAPPLTPAQIDRLGHVASWDLEYTGSYTLTSTGSGGPIPGLTRFPNSTGWTSLEEDLQNFHVKARIAGKSGQSDCQFGTTNPCVVQTTADGRVDDSVFQEHAESELFFSSSVCIPGDPTASTITFNNTNRGGGSYLLNTLPANSRTKPDIEIDYTQNPPILYGNAHFPNVTIHHRIVSGSSCSPSTPDEFDLIGYKLIFADWYPEPDGYPYGGDSQVRIEHGAFVVHGIADWTRKAVLCVPGFASTACADPNTRAPFTESYHSEWVLREHDCQDTNGNGNSDDDDDGLCDNWETDGLDVDGDGVIDLPLNKPPYNADPEHKDLFVEIDYMRKNPVDPNDDEKPSDDALNMVKNAFAFAPVTNPDGLRGVRLHFVGSDATNPDPRKLVDEALPHSDRIGFHKEFVDNAVCDPNNQSTDFDDLKSNHFGTAAERDPNNPNSANILEAKSLAFRYAIFGHQQVDIADPNSNCTQTMSSGVAELPGNDLIVTEGSWRPLPSPAIYSGGGARDCFVGESAETCAERHIDAATFMHEFGHTLGLHHGGSDDVNCKPNYLSVMNYSFQFRYTVSTRPLNYSGGIANGFDNDPFAPLDERNLSEPAGIAGPLALNSVYGLNGQDAYILLNHPIDWNGDPNGRTDETGVSADIARRDIMSACSQGTSADVQNVTLKYGGPLSSTSVPAPSAFGVHLNGGAALTPTGVAVNDTRVYLTLAAPVGIADAVTVDYNPPATNPLQDPNGTPKSALSGVSIANVTGQLKTLFARDDWATLQYDMRLAPEFDDGAPRQAPSDPELTPDEALASAAQADFDGDGISNALDNCPATYNPGQEDLDADGFGDDCEPTIAADHEDPTSVGVASPSTPASGWNNTDVTVNLSATDDPNGSGVRGIDYVMNGAQSEPQQEVAGDAASPIVSSEGETAVKFFAVDNFGNPELPHTVTVRLDRTAPGITAAQDPAPNAAGWNNSDVTVSYTCADTLSGLASCDAPAVIASEGAGLSVTGNATDVAGNAAQLTVSGINIDRTAPVVTCSVTPSVLWPPNHKLVHVHATIDVADPLSGPGGFVLTSVTSSEPESVNRKDKSPDIEEFSVGSPSEEGQLRAERLRKGPGRLYTMTWTGQDAAGNTASCTATVSVPKKKPKKH